MGNGSGVSGGDRNRNAKLARLRALVPTTNAIVGIDLADNKQMVVVCDHDSKVLARRTFRCRAWDLGAALDWAAERPAAKGFAGATVSCEPTGHRWRVLGQLALLRPGAGGWHLGARRGQLIVDMVAQVQQMRALLECVWPAALDTAKHPFKSRTWAAAMSVVCERDGGDLGRTRRLGAARFEQAVRREILKRGGQKPSLRIVRKLFAALADSTGVAAHRPGALERVTSPSPLCRDRRRTRRPTKRLTETGPNA